MSLRKQHEMTIETLEGMISNRDKTISKLKEEIERQKQMRYNVLKYYSDYKIALQEIYKMVTEGPSSEKSELSDAIESIVYEALTFGGE